MHEYDAEYDELVELRGWIALAKHMPGIISDEATAKRELRFIELRGFLLERHSPDRYDLLVREALDRALMKSGQVVPPSPPPQPDSTELASDAFRDGTPFSEIWSESCMPGINWSTDERSTKKGYVCACLSELVYQQMSKFEVRGKDRYRVIPSLMLRELLERNITIDVARMSRNRDIPTTVIDAANFVFGVFNFYQYTIIAVRGTTQSLSDWMVDFDARKVDINGLGYHRGFYRDAEDALPKLIMATPANNNPIYFTGHSLGGAIAGLLPQIWQGPGRVMIPYTFASPRFGTKKVAAKSNVYAYVRALDPVPHIPLEIMGYRSSGWPPVVIPTGDRWLSNWEMAAHWKELLPAHSMEQYRKLMGEECDSKYFPVDVYLKALKTALVDYPDEIP